MHYILKEISDKFELKSDFDKLKKVISEKDDGKPTIILIVDDVIISNEFIYLIEKYDEKLQSSNRRLVTNKDIYTY